MNNQMKFLTEAPPAIIPAGASPRLLPLVTEETYNDFMVGRKSPLADEIHFIMRDNPFLNELALNMHKNIGKFVNEKIEQSRRIVMENSRILAANGKPMRQPGIFPGLTVDESRELVNQAIISTYCMLHRQATKDQEQKPTTNT